MPGNPSNKDAFLRFHEAVGSRDVAVIDRMVDEVVAPDVVFHAPVDMGEPGAAALKRVWRVLLRAYPDIRVTVEDMIAEGDKVVGRSVVTGTHQGEYLGIPATGRAVRYDEIFVLRFAGGKVAEIWGVVDVLAQLRQLGVALPV